MKKLILFTLVVLSTVSLVRAQSNGNSSENVATVHNQVSQGGIEQIRQGSKFLKLTVLYENENGTFTLNPILVNLDKLMYMYEPHVGKTQLVFMAPHDEITVIEIIAEIEKLLQ